MGLDTQGQINININLTILTIELNIWALLGGPVFTLIVSKYTLFIIYFTSCPRGRLGKSK